MAERLHTSVAPTSPSYLNVDKEDASSKVAARLAIHSSTRTGHAETKQWLARYLPPEPPCPPPAVNDGPPEDPDLDRKLVEAELDAEFAIGYLDRVTEVLPQAAALALLRQYGVRTPSLAVLRQSLEARRSLAHRGTLPPPDNAPTLIRTEVLPALDSLAKLLGRDVLRLLTADDAKLLAEATEIAARREARHAAAVAAGKEGIHPRDREARAIRRKLRRLVSKASVHLAGILGLIGGRKDAGLPAYADDWSFRRWKQVQEAGQAFVRSRVLVAPDGHTIPMKDAVDTSTKARESRWYSVLLGMQQIAERRQLVPVFLTLTLPSEFHLHATNGRRGDPCNSPSVAARELNYRWHKVLAMIHQRDVRPFGVRVVEPHSDGCPHLHCCLFLPADGIEDLARAVDRHFPATSDEEVNHRHAGDFSQGPAAVLKTWEPGGKASPAGYVMKYVLKTLRSEQAPDDNEEGAEGGRGGHDRAAAWASLVGVRRLDVIGLRRGTLSRWQSVQRTMRAVGEKGLREPLVRQIAAAMQERNWGLALELLGAFPGEGAQTVAVRRQRVNCWSELVSYTVAYANPATGALVAKVRPREWTLRKIPKGQPADGACTQPTNWNEEDLNNILSHYGLSKVISVPRGSADAVPPGSAGPPSARKRPTMLQISAANDDELPDYHLAV